MICIKAHRRSDLTNQNPIMEVSQVGTVNGQPSATMSQLDNKRLKGSPRTVLISQPNIHTCTHPGRLTSSCLECNPERAESRDLREDGKGGTCEEKLRDMQR